MAICDESRPYIFISYSHRDSEQVISIINHMQSNGYNVWWDEGIDPGTEWDENIAKHVKECSYFVAFVSSGYVGSKNCKDELNYSRDLDKNQLLVYLEEVDLPDGMAMRMNRIQSIFWGKYDDKNVAFEKLFSANGINVAKIGDATNAEYVSSAAQEPQVKQSSITATSENTSEISKIDADKKKKIIMFGGIGGGVAVLTIILIVILTWHKHEWVDATCTEPVTCKGCDKTEGEPLGHDWKEATCLVPSTCSRCGQEEGGLADHVWIEATCSAPRTCKVCNITEGDVLPHEWIEASYDAPQTCANCGETVGKAWMKYDLQEGYKGLSWYRTKYEIALDSDGKYYLKDAEGNNVLDSSLKEVTNGFCNWKVNLEDGAFGLCKKSDDGTDKWYLFDKDLNVIYSSEHKIEAYRDGIVYLRDSEDKIHVYVKEANISWDFGNIADYSYYGNGLFVSRFDNTKKGYTIKASDLVKISKDRAAGNEVDWDAIRNYYTYQEYNVVFYAIPDKDGYVTASLYDADAKYIKAGVYNINTNEFMDDPQVACYSGLMDENGIYVRLYDGRYSAFGVEKISDNQYEYCIYDFVNKEYVSEKFYGRNGSYDFENKYFSVKNSDGKWGYMSYGDWTLQENRYDEATDFCNGYALVKTGDSWYLIDEEFNICSEAFSFSEATANYAASWKCDDGSVCFRVKDAVGLEHWLVFE